MYRFCWRNPWGNPLKIVQVESLQYFLDDSPEKFPYKSLKKSQEESYWNLCRNFAGGINVEFLQMYIIPGEILRVIFIIFNTSLEEFVEAHFWTYYCRNPWNTSSSKL